MGKSKGSGCKKKDLPLHNNFTAKKNIFFLLLIKAPPLPKNTVSAEREKLPYQEGCITLHDRSEKNKKA